MSTLLDEEIISTLSMKDKTKSFHFRMDLEGKSYQQDALIFDRVMKIQIDAYGNEIIFGLSLTENPTTRKTELEFYLINSPFFECAMAAFRIMVYEKNSGQVSDDITGVRVFRVARISDKFAYIDEDGAEEEELFVSEKFVLHPIAQQLRHNFAINIYIDLPGDYFGHENNVRLYGALKQTMDAAHRVVDPKKGFDFVAYLHKQIDNRACPWNDVTITCMSNYRDVGEQFFCNRVVLAMHSPLFARDFALAMQKPNIKSERMTVANGRLYYNILGYDARTVRAFLDYFYTGQIGFDKFGGNANYENDFRYIRLAKLASVYGVDDLANMCENRLITMCDTFKLRMPLMRLADECGMRRLKSVLLPLMAVVPRHMVECAQLPVCTELAKENQRKLLVKVMEI